MALKITKATDPIEINSIKILIYGQPGIGKTSLAFSANKPLLLDFDQGAYRSAYRKDSVPINSWSDIAAITDDDLKDYNTIIVDTVGRALDFLADHLKSNNPKLSQRSGALTLKGYGELKASFAQWLKSLVMRGKDVVMIAHDKEDKNGDNVFIRPDVTGGTYNELFKVADGVGYYYAIDKNRTLDFNPCEAWVGKNPAGFDSMQVPHLSKEPDFMSGLITTVKNKLGELSEESAKAVEVIQDFCESINDIGNAEDADTFMSDIKEQPKAVKAAVWHKLQEHMKSLGFAYDSEQGSFVEVKDAA